jgi:cyclic lactone autoinducer peptide
VKKAILNKCIFVMSNLVLFMATTSISQCCTGVIYQPSVDADLKERIIQTNNKKVLF